MSSKVERKMISIVAPTRSIRFVKKRNEEGRRATTADSCCALNSLLSVCVIKFRIKFSAVIVGQFEVKNLTDELSSGFFLQITVRPKEVRTAICFRLLELFF